MMTYHMMTCISSVFHAEKPVMFAYLASAVFLNIKLIKVKKKLEMYFLTSNNTMICQMFALKLMKLR